MKAILDPESVAAGIALLTPDQDDELTQITEPIADPLEYMAAVTAYLLEHVGLEDIRRMLLLGHGAEALKEALKRAGRIPR